MVSTQLARELFLAAESEEEYDTWLTVLAGKPAPVSIPSMPPKVGSSRELESYDYFLTILTIHFRNWIKFDQNNIPLRVDSQDVVESDQYQWPFGA